MKIYIDPGHGTTGEDTGATGILNGVTINENEQNLLIAKAAQRVLEASGHKVTMSRTENKNCGAIDPLHQADKNLIASANKCKAGDYELMISIHNNDAENPKARGFQLFYKTGNGKKDESKKLADKIGEALNDVVAKNLIGTRVENGADYYGILRLHDKIGVLCECVFMSNSSDLEILVEKSAEIGEKLAEGINNYLGVKTPEIEPQAVYFRVRKSWEDAESQIGAYTVFENAVKCANEHPGYYVFDEDGVALYPITEAELPYKELYEDLSESFKALDSLYVAEQEKNKKLEEKLQDLKGKLGNLAKEI